MSYCTLPQTSLGLNLPPSLERSWVPRSDLVCRVLWHLPQLPGLVQDTYPVPIPLPLSARPNQFFQNVLFVCFCCSLFFVHSLFCAVCPSQPGTAKITKPAGSDTSMVNWISVFSVLLPHHPQDFASASSSTMTQGQPQHLEEASGITEKMRRHTGILRRFHASWHRTFILNILLAALGPRRPLSVFISKKELEECTLE